MNRFALFVICLIAAPAFAAEPVVVKFAGVSAEAMSGWKSEKPANLFRSHQFKLATFDKDYADAELTVTPKSSDDVKKNFEKWKSQFTPADGKKLDDVAKTSEMEVGGIKLYLLDVSGTWKYRERPVDPKSEKEYPEFRTIWVIAIGKEDTAHIRLSGQHTVIEKHYPDFEKWLKSLK